MSLRRKSNTILRKAAPIIRSLKKQQLKKQLKKQVEDLAEKHAKTRKNTTKTNNLTKEEIKKIRKYIDKVANMGMDKAGPFGAGLKKRKKNLTKKKDFRKKRLTTKKTRH
tara:strand:+ start:204 stop:533 length:330 start_codon:yes stop_codon:yes gene_type:complete